MKTAYQSSPKIQLDIATVMTVQAARSFCTRYACEPAMTQARIISAS